MVAMYWNGELMPPKVRCFVFTNYNVGFDYEKLMRDDNSIGYIAYGDEICPTTNRPHHQGWIYFHNQRHWTPTSRVKIGCLFAPEKTEEEIAKYNEDIASKCISATEKKLIKKTYKNKGSAHIEPMGGTLVQNDIYCSKESRLTMLGEKPAQGNRSDLKSVVNEILSGKVTVDDIACSDPLFFHQYGRTLDRVEGIKWKKQFRSWETKGIWLYGKSGTGKTFHHAFKGLKDYDPTKTYSKIINEEFWDGYEGHEEVIFDEFRGQMPFSYLLQIVNGVPLNVKVKGKIGFPFLAKTVVITTPEPPEDTYTVLGKKEGSMFQLYRRFKVYEVVSESEKIERTWEDALKHIQGQAIDVDDIVAERMERDKQAQLNFTLE